MTTSLPHLNLVVAWLWLAEPMSATKVTGALAVLAGVFFTRLGRRVEAIPIEE